MLISGTLQVTIFPSNGGWKFCIAPIDHSTEPLFSDAYADEQAARDEAIAHLRGEPSRYDPMWVDATEKRRQRWEAQIRERRQEIDDPTAYLAAHPDPTAC